MDEPEPTDEAPPLRVLYLEDSAVDADLARRALARLAPEIVLEVVGTLGEALLRVAPIPPLYDVILSDLRLPDGSGLDLLAHIREQELPLAVVLLTGSGDQGAAIAALKSGADDYLIKHGDYLRRLPRTLKSAIARYQEANARRAKPLHVLYAEDNPVDIDLTRRHLNKHAPHIHLEAVISGEEALDRLPGGVSGISGYDVLLLDYQLPKLNALEVAKILRDERGLDLPVVIVSGHGSEEDVAQALRFGVSDYLIKQPGYLNLLPATIERSFQQAQVAREQAALRATTARLKQLLEASPTVLYALQVEENHFHPVYISENVVRLFGYTPEECLQPGWRIAHLHEGDRDRVLTELVVLLEEGANVLEYRMIDGRGAIRWVRDEMRLLKAVGDRAVEVVGTWNDITDERVAEERLRLNASALASTRDAVMITDLAPRILSINPAFERITGYMESEVLGKNPNILNSGRQDRDFYQTMWANLTKSGHWQGEIWNRRKSGETYPEWLSVSTVRNEHGEPTHYVAVASDLTALKFSEERLDHLAHYDPLTDLPNRLLIQSHMQHSLKQARQQNRLLGVLAIDLYQFKTVNDSLGHEKGDELLLAVAERMKGLLRPEDTLARLGGDEFIVVQEGLQEASETERVAGNLLRAMEAPFRLSDGHEVYIGLSIGISLFPQGGIEAGASRSPLETEERQEADSQNGSAVQALLREADAAMHSAKEKGGNRFTFYTNELNVQALLHLEMEGALRRALEQSEFVLHYQPKVSLSTGKIAGGEALLRWNRPGHSIVPPSEFIPLAEKSGLIVPIGAWAIDRVCAQIRSMHEKGLPHVKVAVNVSVRQFLSGDLESTVAEAIRRHGIDPEHLQIELTESMLMDDPENSVTRLHNIKRIGVSLSIDDFGTGYSSLSYLSRYPMDELKIDRSFVEGIVTDPGSASIATSVIDLAHRMQLSVVAEGVETEEQMEYLRKNRCDVIQGYYFSKPVSAQEFEEMLRQDRSLDLKEESTGAKSILVIDDEQGSLSSIASMLGGEGYQVLRARSAVDGMKQMASHNVQVIVSGRQTSDMDGREFLGQIGELHPETVRIILSDNVDLEPILQAVNSGVVYRCLLRPCTDEQLRERVREALQYQETIAGRRGREE